MPRPPRPFRVLSLSFLALPLAPSPAIAAFDLQLSIPSPGSFTPNQLAIVTTAMTKAEALWESVITGYQPGINIPSLPITIGPMFSGLGASNYTSTTFQGGYTLATAGFITLNVNEIENFANWHGGGLNFIDELIEHEIGHVLGIGPLWVANHVYVTDTYQYTGAFGLAAYRAEYNPSAAFIPVENAGNPGTPNFHWDQRMRSSALEGNPADPFSLDPRIGITDHQGRDLALELMTGAIDPDYGEPYLSNTTIQSLRDLGFTVIPEPSAAFAVPLLGVLAGRRRLS